MEGDLGRRLVEPDDESVAGVGLDGRERHVDAAARVRDVDAVAGVVHHVAGRDVEVAGAVAQSQSGHAVGAHRRALHVRQTAHVDHRYAAGRVLRHRRVRHVDVVRFAARNQPTKPNQTKQTKRKPSVRGRLIDDDFWTGNSGSPPVAGRQFQVEDGALAGLSAVQQPNLIHR